MDLETLAHRASDILFPALPFIYEGKDVVVKKVGDVLLEEGIKNR